MFENQSEVIHGGEKKKLMLKEKKKKTLKSADELFFPLCQLQQSVSVNRPVPLVLCFVGVHHLYGQYLHLAESEQSKTTSIDFV